MTTTSFFKQIFSSKSTTEKTNKKATKTRFFICNHIGCRKFKKSHSRQKKLEVATSIKHLKHSKTLKNTYV